MDLTPLVPAGRQVIERYGPSGFRVTGVIWRGPVLVFPELTLPWTAIDAAAIDWESLTPVVEHGGVQILLLGLGGRMTCRGPRIARPAARGRDHRSNRWTPALLAAPTTCSWPKTAASPRR